MIRGLYTAAAGMLAGLARHETIVHNLANTQTAGYKADRATLRDFPSMLLHEIRNGKVGPEVGQAGTGVSLANLSIDFSIGPLKLTNHPLDLAIVNDGFFRIQTPDGVRYGRDGRFHRDADGRLVTAEGNLVLGQNGPITLPDGDLTVSQQGELFINDTPVEQLSLARFADLDQVIKEGDTLFTGRDGQEPELLAADQVQIYQGYLEQSNVETAQAVTEMLAVSRAYHASQRLVQFQDQINGQATTELGRV